MFEGKRIDVIRRKYLFIGKNIKWGMHSNAFF